MPELRKDPIIGRWVIISSERAKRPSSFNGAPQPALTTECPFCPGNESNTPPEIISYRESTTAPNQPGWSLRVIPNKYPALMVEGDVTREPNGLYDQMNGVGAHEVIIETPEHNSGFINMPITQIRDIFWAYRERMLDLERDSRLKYIQVFKNHGEAAGASLEHSHSQLIATPIIPKRVAEELKGAEKYFNFKERCIFCDILRQEISDQERIVAEFDSFISLEPYAPRFPFETWILPKSHQSSYIEMSEDEYLVLAECMKETLQRLAKALNDPPFNFMIHTRPVSKKSEEYYHWHIEIIPKLTKMAGFEWGSGFYINPTTPEEAAAYLKEIKL